MRVDPVPVISFAAGAALVGAGVVGAIELASVFGVVLIGGAFLSLVVRSS